MTRRSTLSRLTAATGLLFFVAACASAPSGPPPLDPVGSYAFTADAQGQAISGMMTIQGEEGAYSGEITSDMMPAISISSVVVSGQAMTISANGPTGPLVVEVTLAGGAFDGTWAMGGLTGTLTGMKN